MPISGRPHRYSKPYECKCDNFFTCGYCLRNAKPYHYSFGVFSDNFPKNTEQVSDNNTEEKNKEGDK